MRSADDCVTDIAKFLKSELGKSNVFKYDDKPDTFSGNEYIAVNNLPFVFGRLVNDDNVINVNLHRKALTTGKAPNKELQAMLQEVMDVIPTEADQEDGWVLMIEGVYYTVKSYTRPMEDKDGTYFINVQLKVVFNQLNFN